MPRKVRELISDLLREGFNETPAKGSHRKFRHPLYSGSVILSGRGGADAKPYQERDVSVALRVVRGAAHG